MPTNILIVDDSSFSRRMIKRSLPELWRSLVTEASGGRHALKLCETHQYDLMFLDLTMPDIDGLEVLKVLSERGVKSKIFVISADAQRTSKEMVLQLGATDFLEKPLDAAKLTETLTKHGVLS